MKLATFSLTLLAAVSALDIRADASDGITSGIKGAITNLKQTADTLREQLQTHDGHATQDTINAAITGLDSQIDNFAATLGNDLNGVTLGLSGKIGDILLGPVFQAVTNGAEVVVSNVVGGAVDIVSDGTAKAFSMSLAELHSIGEKLNVDSKDLKSLANVQQQVANLKAPSKGSMASNSTTVTTSKH